MATRRTPRVNRFVEALTNDANSEYRRDDLVSGPIQPFVEGRQPQRELAGELGSVVQDDKLLSTGFETPLQVTPTSARY